MPECGKLSELERVLEPELVRLQLYRLISVKTSSRSAKPQVIGSDLLHLLGPRARAPSFSSLPARRIFTNKADDVILGKKGQTILKKPLFLLVRCHNLLANESQRGDNRGKAVVVAPGSG